MPTFFIRVEVYESEDFDYTDLHEELELRQIQRTADLSGHEVFLPDGTYATVEHATADDVMAAVSAALSALGRKAGVVVAPVDETLGGLTTNNLRSVL